MFQNYNKRQRYAIGIISYMIIYIFVSGFTVPFGDYQQTSTPYKPPTVTEYPTGFVTNPFPITGTPILDCPVGTPIGYGTLTPNAMWNLACGGNCLPTQTMYPTLILPTARPTYNYKLPVHHPQE